MADLLKVSIKSPDTVYYEGDASAVTSISPQGIFDVLPEHEHFIAMVKNKIIIHKTDKRDQEIEIDIGLLRVLENKVSIFIGLDAVNSTDIEQS